MKNDNNTLHRICVCGFIALVQEKLKQTALSNLSQNVDFSTNHGLTYLHFIPLGTVCTFVYFDMCDCRLLFTLHILRPCTFFPYQLAPVRITGTIPTSEHTVYENGTITLACYIEGDPTPSVKWEKVEGKAFAFVVHTL